MRKTISIILLLGCLLTASTMNAYGALAEEETEKVIYMAESDINLAIKEVTYLPNPPEKNEQITFSVKVSLENWDHSAPIGFWFDGDRDPITYHAWPDENYEYAYCDIEINWPDDLKEHSVKIMVDPPQNGFPDGILPETNEDDNTWENSLKAPKVKKLVSNYEQIFPSSSPYSSPSII